MISKVKVGIYAIFCILSILWVIVFMYIFKNANRKVRIIWAKAQKFFLGYKVELIGEFSKEADMIIINHQSMVDIVVIEELHPRNICWLAKKEIDDTPIIGQIIKIPKMIAVDRKNPRDLVRIVKEAKDRIENKRVLAIFPEGTRGKTKELLPFQSGAKMIADKLDLKVQPVVLIGARDIVNSHDLEVNFGKKLKVICLDLIDRSDKDWLEKARENMQKVIDENIK